MTPTQPKIGYFITIANRHGVNDRAVTTLIDESTDAKEALAGIRQSESRARLVEVRQYR